MEVLKMNLLLLPLILLLMPDWIECGRGPEDLPSTSRSRALSDLPKLSIIEDIHSILTRECMIEMDPDFYKFFDRFAFYDPESRRKEGFQKMRYRSPVRKMKFRQDITIFEPLSSIPRSLLPPTPDSDSGPPTPEELKWEANPREIKKLMAMENLQKDSNLLPVAMIDRLQEALYSDKTPAEPIKKFTADYYRRGVVGIDLENKYKHSSTNKFIPNSERELLFRRLTPYVPSEFNRRCHMFKRKEANYFRKTYERFVLDGRTLTDAFRLRMISKYPYRNVNLQSIFGILKGYGGIFKTEIQNGLKSHIPQGGSPEEIVAGWKKFYKSQIRGFKFKLGVKTGKTGTPDYSRPFTIYVGVEDVSQGKLKLYVPAEGTMESTKKGVIGRPKLVEYSVTRFESLSRGEVQKDLAQSMLGMHTMDLRNFPEAATVPYKMQREIFYYLAHQSIVESALPDITHTHSILTESRPFSLHPLVTNPNLDQMLTKSLEEYIGNYDELRHKNPSQNLPDVYDFLHKTPVEYYEPTLKKVVRGSRRSTEIAEQIVRGGQEIYENQACAAGPSRVVRGTTSPFCRMSDGEMEGKWRAADSDDIEAPNRKVNRNLRMMSEVSGKIYEFPLKENTKKRPRTVFGKNIRRLGGRIGAFMEIGLQKSMGAFFNGLAALGFIGGIKAMEQGEILRGGTIATMSGIQLGSTVGKTLAPETFRKLEKFGKAIKKSLVKSVERGAMKFARMVQLSSRASIRLSTIAGKSAAKILPVIGVIIDLYFIGDDIRKMSFDSETDIPKWMMGVGLGLDVAILTAGLAMMKSGVGMLAGIVVVGLTFIRMTFVSAFTSGNWHRDHCADQDKWNRFLCYQKGYYLGMVDFFLQGYLLRGYQLEDAEKTGKEKLKEFENIENYASIEGSCERGTAKINFASDEASSAGGSIKFRLFDDQSYEYSLPLIRYGESNRREVKKGTCNTLRTIILGLGQTIVPSYRRQSAAIDRSNKICYDYICDFLRIQGEKPQESTNERKYTLLVEIDHSETSLHGQYTGNNKNNTFISVQPHVLLSLGPKCGKLDERHENYDRHRKYKYVLEGMDGNDTFVMGSQWTEVVGGNGHDTYIVYAMGGKTVIKNYATDSAMDYLVINVPSYKDDFSAITCKRSGEDIEILFCGGQSIVIVDWFSFEDNQHMTFRSEDGVIFDIFQSPKDSEGYKCFPVSIDLKDSAKPEVIELQLDPTGYLSRVQEVVGPRNHPIVATGNAMANTLIALKQDSHLQGNEGADNYLFFGNETVLITNCDESENPETDIVSIETDYEKIRVAKSGDHLSIEADDQVFGLYFWFSKGEKCQHAIFKTRDNCIFEVKVSETGLVYKVLLILDFSDSIEPVEVDLNDGVAPGLPLAADTSQVMTVISSKHGDSLRGNGMHNVFDCRGNGTYMEGRNGIDTYNVNKNCTGTINLCSFDDSVDRIVVNCDFSDLHLCLTESSQELFISCSRNFQTQYCNGSNAVEIKEWKSQEECRRFELVTSDGITATAGSIRDDGVTVETVANSLAIGDINNNFCCNVDLETYKMKDVRVLREVSNLRVLVPNLDMDLRGNHKKNMISIGQTDVNCSIYLEGRNNSDVYAISNRHGLVTINNYATDGATDYLRISIPFHRLNITTDENQSVLLFDRSNSNNSRIRLKSYWGSNEFQHLIIISGDEQSFRLVKGDPPTEMMVVDRSRELASQYIQYPEDYSGIQSIRGSENATNLIFGSRASKHIAGGQRDDTLIGGSGDEFLSGGGGNDTIYGSAGSDYILGGPGYDSLHGGPGDDFLYGGLGSDILNGGPGTDTAIFEGTVGIFSGQLDYFGVWVSLKKSYGRHGDAEYDYLKNIENVVGSIYNDTIEDDDRDNTLVGGKGDDTLISNGGLDELSGGSGMDVYDLEKASGVKKIDNFDNETDASSDHICLANRTEEVSCSYRYLQELFLSVGENLVIVLKGFFNGPESQHLYINTSKEEVVDLREHIPDVNITKIMLIDVSVSETETEFIRFNLSCSDCLGEIRIFYTDVFANSSKWLGISPTADNFSISGLLPGQLYSFLPTIMICGQTVAQGKTVSVSTKPAFLPSVSAKIVSGNFIELAWTSGIEAKNIAEYVYEVQISSKIVSASNETSRNESIDLVTPKLWIHVPIDAIRVEVCVRVQPVAYGSRGNWTAPSAFSFTQRSPKQDSVICFVEEEVEEKSDQICDYFEIDM